MFHIFLPSNSILIDASLAPIYGKSRNNVTVAVETYRTACLVLCVAVASLTTYRVHIWLTHYKNLGSKMMISAYDERQHDLPFPLVTICNINPARGTELYDTHPTSSGSQGSEYELFTDAYQGRTTDNVHRDKLKLSVYHLIDRASHRLTDMLKSCTVGRKVCFATNFTKSMLPTGSCYTFNGVSNVFDELQLTLDPQSYDYVVPNQGFVGFRILLHSQGDPLWALMPTAVYAGPTFHTMLRVVGLKKVYKEHCVPQKHWARCIERCVQDALNNSCHCHMPDCTLLDMTRCKIKMKTMAEDIPPSQCRCQNPCERITYSIESITQALKTPLFAHSSRFYSMTTGVLGKSFVQRRETGALEGQSTATSLPSGVDYQRAIDGHSSKARTTYVSKEAEKYQREVWDGSLIQTWAFLREANRTAFEQLRQLSRLLQTLHMDLQTVERAVASVQVKHNPPPVSVDVQPAKWELPFRELAASGEPQSHTPDRVSGLCMNTEEDARMLARVHQLGEEFVRLFRQSVLFRDIPRIPGEDFHVHLVRLFFLQTVPELDQLATHLKHNDLFSDVTMLDLQRKAHQCKQTSSGGNSESRAKAPVGPNDTNGARRMIFAHTAAGEVQASEDIVSLQAVLLNTDSQFRKLRDGFTRLVKENEALVSTTSIDRDRLISATKLTHWSALVTMTIRATRDQNRLVRLASVQTIYNPMTELIDLIVSGLVLAFLAVFLLDVCATRRSGDRGSVCCAQSYETNGAAGDDLSPNKPPLLICSDRYPLEAFPEATHLAAVINSDLVGNSVKRYRPTEIDLLAMRPATVTTTPTSGGTCPFCPLSTSILSPNIVSHQDCVYRPTVQNPPQSHCANPSVTVSEQAAIDLTSSTLDADSAAVPSHAIAQSSAEITSNPMWSTPHRPVGSQSSRPTREVAEATSHNPTQPCSSSVNDTHSKLTSFVPSVRHGKIASFIKEMETNEAEILLEVFYDNLSGVLSENEDAEYSFEDREDDSSDSEIIRPVKKSKVAVVSSCSRRKEQDVYTIEGTENPPQFQESPPILVQRIRNDGLSYETIVSALKSPHLTGQGNTESTLNEPRLSDSSQFRTDSWSGLSTEQQPQLPGHAQMQNRNIVYSYHAKADTMDPQVSQIYFRNHPSSVPLCSGTAAAAANAASDFHTLPRNATLSGASPMFDTFLVTSSASFASHSVPCGPTSSTRSALLVVPTTLS
ncbi:unnamed protein product [Calicophoron daubneyi]|uniref:Uncharacterized protein n=1 Tax=Calicophoron daubneyi TaxID=300641 RepID=A0AAV2TLX1_CALDB